MEQNVTNASGPGARRRRPLQRGRHAAGAGNGRALVTGEHVDAGGFCRCCGAPFPCSAARRHGGGRELSEPVGPALGATPGAGPTFQRRDLRTEQKIVVTARAAASVAAVALDAGGQLTVPAVDVNGRAVAIQVAVRRETVELWCAAGRRSVLDRGAVRAWVSDPVTDLAADDVTLTCAEPGAVALSVTGVLDRWTLAPHVLDALRDRL